MHYDFFLKKKTKQKKKTPQILTLRAYINLQNKQTSFPLSKNIKKANLDKSFKLQHVIES